MARTSPRREAQFTEELRKAGGACGGVSLQKILGWEDDIYLAVLQSLLGKSAIVRGRGRLLRLAGYASDIGNGSEPLEGEAENEIADEVYTSSLRARERDLYGPIVSLLKKDWVSSRNYDDYFIEETHSQGSRNTGGTYTRPDVTVVGMRTYDYIPGRHFEVVTFEVKPATSVSVVGVLEALAHREAAHRVYVVYNVSAEEFNQLDESVRIQDMAQKFGVGVILLSDPNSYET